MLPERRDTPQRNPSKTIAAAFAEIAGAEHVVLRGPRNGRAILCRDDKRRFIYTKHSFSCSNDLGTRRLISALSPINASVSSRRPLVRRFFSFPESTRLARSGTGSLRITGRWFPTRHKTALFRIYMRQACVCSRLQNFADSVTACCWPYTRLLSHHYESIRK